MFDDDETDKLARIVKEKEGVKKKLEAAQEAVVLVRTELEAVKKTRVNGSLVPEDFLGLPRTALDFL